MNIDYSQFLNMIPEVTLTALLVIVFIADFCTARKPGDESRKWFNPLVCILMTAHLLFNMSTTEAATAFSGRCHQDHPSIRNPDRSYSE